MAQPRAYTRQANFTDHTTESPSDPQVGSKLDSEFDAINLTPLPRHPPPAPPGGESKNVSPFTDKTAAIWTLGGCSYQSFTIRLHVCYCLLKIFVSIPHVLQQCRFFSLHTPPAQSRVHPVEHNKMVVCIDIRITPTIAKKIHLILNC